MVLADTIQRRYADAFFAAFDLTVDPVYPGDIFAGQNLADAAAAFQPTVAQQI